MNIKNFLKKNIHVVGISGAEGSAVVDFLISNGAKNVTGHDFRTKREFIKSFKLTHIQESREQRNHLLRQFRNIDIKYKDHYLEDIENADLIFVSQAWFRYDPNFPKLADVRKQGIPFATITQLYFDLSPSKIIGITGTNGKSTTAKLANNILQASSLTSFFSGNDRHNVQILNQLERMKPEDAFLLEISNRQLLELHQSPHIAVITNITPDHLDDHGTFENYVMAKQRIFQFQEAHDYAVLNFDNAVVRDIAEECPSQIYWFSMEAPPERGACCIGDTLTIIDDDGEHDICRKDDLNVRGNHNIYNVLAAALATYLAGVSIEVIRQEVKQFSGLDFRIQFVDKVDGTSFYNDIKSTTPEATLAALGSFSEPVILIAGGGGKGLKYKKLAEKIIRDVKDVILLPGTGSQEIEREIKRLDENFHIINAENLETAVADAKSISAPGDVVLLSPACPEFFTSFVQGKSFAGLVTAE